MDERIPIGRRPIDRKMFRIGARLLLEEPAPAEPEPGAAVGEGAGVARQPALATEGAAS
jgi:hypothetical protein